MTSTERLLFNGLIVGSDPIASGVRVIDGGEMRYNWALFGPVDELERGYLKAANDYNTGVGALPGTDYARASVRASKWHTLVVQRHGFNV